MLIKLAELSEGEIGTIKKVEGTGRLRTRLFEMGFIKGQEVKLVKYAPLQDPIEFFIMDTRVCLRHDEANNIFVDSKSIKEKGDRIKVQ